MKFSRTLTVASLASLATAFEPTYQESENKTLTGQEALDFLFKYDPSRPHREDSAVLSLPDGNPSGLQLGYDQGYLWRVCMPREYTGEQYEYLKGAPIIRQRPDTWEKQLEQSRGLWASSPFPCEKQKWIKAECGVATRGQIESGISVEDQNSCLCGGGYWVADFACNSCYSKHHGNETLKVKDEKISDDIFAAICAPDAKPTALNEYFAKYADEYALPTSIVSDAIPGETAPGKYWPGAGSDLLPATIQSPSFVRTVDSAEVTMTPGAQFAVTESATGGATATVSGAKETASASVSESAGGSATTSAATVATGAAGAMKPVGGLVAGVIGAALLL